MVAAGKFIDLRRLAWLMDRAVRINTAKCNLTKTMAYQQIVDGLRTGASLNGMVRCYSLWRLGRCGNLVFGAVEGLSLA